MITLGAFVYSHDAVRFHGWTFGHLCSDFTSSHLSNTITIFTMDVDACQHMSTMRTFVDFMAAGALACGFYRFCEPHGSIPTSSISRPVSMNYKPWDGKILHMTTLGSPPGCLFTCFPSSAPWQLHWGSTCGNQTPLPRQSEKIWQVLHETVEERGYRFWQRTRTHILKGHIKNWFLHVFATIFSGETTWGEGQLPADGWKSRVAIEWPNTRGRASWIHPVLVECF